MAYGTAGGIAPVAPPIRKRTPLNGQQIVGSPRAFLIMAAYR
jgi:hypothetical protein